MIGRNIIFAVLAITILGAAVYANSIGGKFIWDDEFLIEENAFIKAPTPGNIRNIFTKDIGAGAGRAFAPYRPLQIASYAKDRFLWGQGVYGYHLTNIALHIMTGLAVFWLALILCKDTFVSGLAAALFVVHPVHTEAVAYISGRADPLSAFFMLLALIFYIKAIDSPKIISYILMGIFFAAAVFSRESALILPALILLYHYAFRKRLRPAGIIIMLAVALLFIISRSAVIGNIHFKAHPATVFQRLPGALAAFADYIKLLFVPAGLHMGYGDRIFAFGLRSLAGVVLLCSFIVYIFRIRRRGGILFFAAGWFAITLLPQSNLYPVGAYMAEHWLYLPSIGFFLAAAELLRQAIRKGGIFKIAAISLAVAALTLYSYLTIRQNSYWRDPVTFYETTIRYVSDDPKLYTNLANTYYNAGEKEKSVRLYKKALELNPRGAIIYFNLGNALSDLGRRSEAMAAYKRALELKPDFAQAREELESHFKGMPHDL